VSNATLPSSALVKGTLAVTLAPFAVTPLALTPAKS